LRTSSAANVGTDKDSERRQRLAIAAFAKRSRFEIADADWFYDPAVSGADEIEKRPGFTALLNRIENNGVRVVIVEDASCFARKLMTQELGILSLVRRGVRVLTAAGDDLTDTDDDMRVAIRQVMGAFAELEKKRLVKKLRGARERKKAETGKCEGNKSFAEREGWAALREAVLSLNDGRSLREMAEALAAQGFLSGKGTLFAASAVQSMLEHAGVKSNSRAVKRTVRGKRALAA
jgi:DNA invertase Pin-like site-specific DNA recombinase